MIYRLTMINILFQELLAQFGTKPDESRKNVVLIFKA